MYTDSSASEAELLSETKDWVFSAHAIRSLLDSALDWLGRARFPPSKKAFSTEQAALAWGAVSTRRVDALVPLDSVVFSLRQRPLRLVFDTS